MAVDWVLGWLEATCQGGLIPPSWANLSSGTARTFLDYPAEHPPKSNHGNFEGARNSNA